MARYPLLSLLALLALVGCTKPEGQRLEREAVQALYTDHTAVGYHERKNFGFRRYYAPDGRLEAWNDRQGHRQGRWWVSNDGRHCVQMANTDEHCRDIYRGADGHHRKYGWVWCGYRLLLSYRDFQPGRHTAP